MTFQIALLLNCTLFRWYLYLFFS